VEATASLVISGVVKAERNSSRLKDARDAVAETTSRLTSRARRITKNVWSRVQVAAVVKEQATGQRRGEGQSCLGATDYEFTTDTDSAVVVAAHARGASNGEGIVRG